MFFSIKKHDIPVWSLHLVVGGKSLHQLAEDNALENQTVKGLKHYKKRLSIFPSLAGMSLTKGKITKLFYSEVCLHQTHNYLVLFLLFFATTLIRSYIRHKQ
jgi:hypothetical protein